MGAITGSLGLLHAPRSLGLAPPTLTLRHLWVPMTLTATFVRTASGPMDSGDAWWTLAAGAWMVAHGTLLVVDPFNSAPAVAGQVNVQWLAQLVYIGLYGLGGVALVLAATAAVATAAYAIVLAAVYHATRRLRLSCALTLVAYALGSTNMAPRAQTLVFGLFATFLLAVVHARQRGSDRWLHVLPLVTLVWANLHGSFVLGLLLLACETTGTAVSTRSWRATRPYLAAFAACTLAACVTPFGVGSLRNLATVGGDPIVRDLMTEWRPASVTLFEGATFFLSVAALGCLVLRSPARLAAADWLMLASFGWLALSAVRSVVWWGMVITCVAAPLAAALPAVAAARAPSRAREQPWLNYTIGAAVVLLFGFSLPWLKDLDPLLPAPKRGLVAGETPLGVSQFLRAHTYAGVMLNYQGWGGYFDWAVWPTHQPFVDVRVEIHPARVWLDYLTMVGAGPGWRELLDTYGVGYAVLNKSEQPALVSALRAETTWRCAYEDEAAVVLTRTPPGLGPAATSPYGVGDSAHQSEQRGEDQAVACQPGAP